MYRNMEKLQQDLVLYLPLDEGNGDIAKDLSKNGCHGKIIEPEWISNGAKNFLLFLDKTHVTIPHYNELSLAQSITVMAWIYMYKVHYRPGSVISKGTGRKNMLSYELVVKSQDYVLFQFHDEIKRYECLSPGIQPGEWHHVSGTFDGEYLRCFVDGKLSKEIACLGTMPYTDAPLIIGQSGSTGRGRYCGIIRGISIFKRSLNEEEIHNLIEPSAITDIHFPELDRGAIPFDGAKLLRRAVAVHAGEETVHKIFAGLITPDQKTKPKQKAEWFHEVMTRMDQTLDWETMRKIRSDCSCRPLQREVKEHKQIWKKYNDLQEYAKATQELWHKAVLRKDGSLVVCIERHRCHCHNARDFANTGQSTPLLFSKTFCQCCAECERKKYEQIFGCRVDAGVEMSYLTGGKVCLIRLNFPDGIELSKRNV